MPNQKNPTVREPTLIYNPNANSRPILSSDNCGQKWLSYWPVRYACIILCCVSFAIWYLKHYYSYSSSTPSHPEASWDFLLFSQSYPITSCLFWVKGAKGVSKTNQCHFASDRYAWTVHGIWPTLRDTEGPSNCRGASFDETALEPIKTELQDRWPSIKSENNSGFWEHEWKKHGRCAVQDRPAFDSELTYFKLGLEWNKKFNLKDALTNAGITPSNTKAYNKRDFQDAVKLAFGKSPLLTCFRSKIEDQHVFLVNEIRLCMSKDLQLLDCDSMYSKTNFDTCPDEIFYPHDFSIRGQ